MSTNVTGANGDIKAYWTESFRLLPPQRADSQRGREGREKKADEYDNLCSGLTYVAVNIKMKQKIKVGILVHFIWASKLFKAFQMLYIFSFFIHLLENLFHVENKRLQVSVCVVQRAIQSVLCRGILFFDKT